MFSEESGNSRDTERSTLTGKKGNAARWSDDLILRQIDEYEARPCLWPETSCSRDFARATAGELSSTSYLEHAKPGSRCTLKNIKIILRL